MHTVMGFRMVRSFSLQQTTAHHAAQNMPLPTALAHSSSSSSSLYVTINPSWLTALAFICPSCKYKEPASGLNRPLSVLDGMLIPSQRFEYYIVGANQMHGTVIGPIKAEREVVATPQGGHQREDGGGPPWKTDKREWEQIQINQVQENSTRQINDVAELILLGVERYGHVGCHVFVRLSMNIC